MLYGVDGTSAPARKEIDHLTGYAWSRPVRIGNAAYGQHQFDILGAIVDCVFQHTRIAGLTRPSGPGGSSSRLSRRRSRSWRQPDQGIWEIRGEAQHFTFSKVMCWVAADRGARLAALRGEKERADEWWRAAQEIHADICEHALGANGASPRRTARRSSTRRSCCCRCWGSCHRETSASARRSSRSPKSSSDDIFVYRYRTETTDDGIGEPEASFTVCSFWLVSALVEIGELDRARTHCERLLGIASTLGLYGEELDPTTARHLGNFPQALTHLSLINALLHVIEAERQDTDGPLGLAASPNWWAAAGRDERPGTGPV